MRRVFCAAVALLAGTALCAEPIQGQWDCDTAHNFVTGVKYSQIDLTDGCPACGANPKYGGVRGDIAKAVHYCKLEAARFHKAGFFFQRHQNGHEICGFFDDSAAVQQAGTRVWHGHRKGSQICMRSPAPTKKHKHHGAGHPQKHHGHSDHPQKHHGHSDHTQKHHGHSDHDKKHGAAAARAAVRAGIQELKELRELLMRLARGDVKVRVGGCFPVGGQVWCLGAQGAWSRESDGCVYKAKEHGVYCPGKDGEWHRVSAGANRDPTVDGKKKKNPVQAAAAAGPEEGEYEYEEEGGVLAVVVHILFNLLLCLGLCSCLRLAIRRCRRRARKRDASLLPQTCQDGVPIVVKCHVLPDPAVVKEQQEGGVVVVGLAVESA